MTKPDGHTALPWFVVRYGDGDSLVIHSDEVNRVCFMATPGKLGSQAKIEANAALICRAVNCHADAMQALVKAAVVLSGNATTKNALTDALESVRDVLARAKEQTP